MTENVRKELKYSDGIAYIKKLISISIFPSLFTITERCNAIKCFAYMISRFPQELNRQDKIIVIHCMEFVRIRGETGTGPINAACLAATAKLALVRPELKIALHKRIEALLDQFKSLSIEMKCALLKAIFPIDHTAKIIKDVEKLIKQKELFDNDAIHALAIRAYVSTLVRLNKTSKEKVRNGIMNSLAPKIKEFESIDAKKYIFKTYGYLLQNVEELSEPILEILTDNISNRTAFQQLGYYYIKQKNLEKAKELYDLAFSHVKINFNMTPDPKIHKMLFKLAIAFPEFTECTKRCIIIRLDVMHALFCDFALISHAHLPEQHDATMKTNKWPDYIDVRTKNLFDANLIYQSRSEIKKLTFFQKINWNDFDFLHGNTGHFYFLSSQQIFADQVSAFSTIVNYRRDVRHLLPIFSFALKDQQSHPERPKCQASDVAELLGKSSNYYNTSFFITLIHFPQYIDNPCIITLFEDLISIRDTFDLMTKQHL
ncbi:hypothetical protein TVAG_069960 [Trichomonas vaginalis G3]|uniref:Uncharacterized protein n=1 Tax=Trichomonas vaginalis (strain ATCC PRA-98 / G3) TaxID=412133 RepID=A2ESN7_TRIV3|nr:armadillo (ARM) repeat-containing protein family [Trichomonas vaginalis G3]EAY04346.1 hypothetical protein TVAG_069960 [Trichomonas vaginalis G3]KAI5551919.1 armadillo (ARM) repeat-containing protein family [Trichomonas vaginalis G3]|eukprot:XP_001316569.1 hypothetical protein [Trichomonas vaginalis G3]